MPQLVIDGAVQGLERRRQQDNRPAWLKNRGHRRQGIDIRANMFDHIQADAGIWFEAPQLEKRGGGRPATFHVQVRLVRIALTQAPDAFGFGIDCDHASPIQQKAGEVSGPAAHFHHPLPYVASSQPVLPLEIVPRRGHPRLIVQQE